ncbi:MAG: hypothetical protein DWQ44_01115 [Bacteroidetes bacterium]|nr:MAG: hypothetical protein DWQ33_00580 [Bacteroidota bacterium]REK04982.1 MAG: hypothetical protein DWQ39_07140 [Bacteroidota bacterium]REK36514.1 MAG: hypothetical protein DWQ44_01115 [Bacteroidota bacterium]REK50880.1 MAG: hypothetical protein DWQ48_01975 [Bacteroidota bacterium]
MPYVYQIHKQDGVYFLTLTIVGWVDLFVRDRYEQIVVDSLNYCTTNKGLLVFAYVIMPSHLHMIVSSNNNDLSNVIASFKKFTSRKLTRTIKSEGESRQD